MNDWIIDPYTRSDKEICIFNNKEYLSIVIPYDDVDHKKVDSFVIELARKLNNIRDTGDEKLVKDFPKGKDDKEIGKMILLLRRVYNVIEMEHLNHHKLDTLYDSNKFAFPKSLGEDIFNYLQSRSETFRRTAIKRQKRYRNRQKERKNDK
jgi:hypothetical protein